MTVVRCRNAVWAFSWWVASSTPRRRVNVFIHTTLNKHRHTQTVRLHHTPPTDHHLETISSIIIYIHSIGTRIEITYIRMTYCEPFKLHATPPLEGVSCNPLKDQRLHPCLNVLLIHKHYNLGRQECRKWWQDMQVSEKNLNNVIQKSWTKHSQGLHANSSWDSPPTRALRVFLLQFGWQCNKGQYTRFNWTSALPPPVLRTHC